MVATWKKMTLSRRFTDPPVTADRQKLSEKDFPTKQGTATLHHGCQGLTKFYKNKL